MKTIWKYKIPLQDFFEVSLPRGAEILTVKMQDNKPCMWAIVETEAAEEQVEFFIYGTGHTMLKDNLAYIGTFIDDIFVWHLFKMNKDS